MLRALIFALLVPGTVLVLIPYRILAMSPRWTFFDIGSLSLAGLLPIALGAVITAWCFLGFITEGHGTPAPYDPPRRLVTGHLYRYVRKPIYVGVLLILVGEALVFRSLLLFGYVALVWLSFHLFVVLYEEPVLLGRFGAEYYEYLRRVPRWLPKFGGRSER